MAPELENRVAHFLARFPQSAALVRDVPFRKKEGSSKNTALRPVLVISVHGLGKAPALIAAYQELLFGCYLSFYLWEKTTHLFTQFQGAFYDFGFWVIPILKWEIKTKLYRFRTREIKPPSSRRIELVVQLSKEETGRFRAYLTNIARGYKAMLGPYFDPGTQISQGELENNRGDPGHNCTSWVTTAPIGENGRSVLELLGTDRSHQVGTNPGWWAHWMLYSVNAERLPLVIYWSADPLAKVLSEQVVSGQAIAWDFNKK